MDSRVVQSDQVHENDKQHPDNIVSQQVTHGAEEPNSDHEKKSVMNRVKEKARKMKDSIKKQGQNFLDQGDGRGNEGDLVEDKEMVEDPDVHEAPIYESEGGKSATPESKQVENLEKTGIDVEGTKVMGEEVPHHHEVEGFSSTTEVNQNMTTDTAKTFGAEEEKPRQSEVNLKRPIVLEEDPNEQGSRSPEAYTLPNYQTKVTDLNGERSDEIEDITPFKESFERMNVQDEPKPTTEQKIQPTFADNEYPSAGSHDQFMTHLAATETETQNEHPHETISTNTNRNQEILPATGQTLNMATEINQNMANDQAKTFGAEEEKPRQGEVNLERPIVSEEVPHEQESRPEAYTLPNYQTKVTDPNRAGSDEIEDIAPVEESFEKMNVQDEPKPTTEQKIQPTVADTEYPPSGSHDQFVPHLSAPPTETHNEHPQETISTNINRNSEILSETGQTPNNNTTTIVEKQPPYESVETQPKHNSYTDEISPSITADHETLSPKSDEAFKGDRNDEVSETKSGGVVKDDGGESGDKGVSSVKGYLAEKLKPGEEDKALSEVISEALHKPVKEEHDGNLGSGDDIKKSEKVGEGSYLTKVKGVVGSWFAKSEENQSPQAAGGEDLSKNKDSVAEVEQVSQVVDERRTHE